METIYDLLAEGEVLQDHFVEKNPEAAGEKDGWPGMPKMLHRAVRRHQLRKAGADLTPAETLEDHWDKLWGHARHGAWRKSVLKDLRSIPKHQRPAEHQQLINKHQRYLNRTKKVINAHLGRILSIHHSIHKDAGEKWAEHLNSAKGSDKKHLKSVLGKKEADPKKFKDIEHVRKLVGKGIKNYADNKHVLEPQPANVHAHKDNKKIIDRAASELHRHGVIGK